MNKFALASPLSISSESKDTNIMNKFALLNDQSINIEEENQIKKKAKIVNDTSPDVNVEPKIIEKRKVVTNEKIGGDKKIKLDTDILDGGQECNMRKLEAELSNLKRELAQYKQDQIRLLTNPEYIDEILQNPPIHY